eukprot:TRINITY_DN74332_c0_g1_i1.p1 TRINITY_DN74332_c0_g1~~TRINITY_DN74332_c0_g1_i1.p1  ORF type:complete len:341 (+),score=70.54 TRINITY_DN74332_c0_g1_i1:64-1023(+)
MYQGFGGPGFSSYGGLTSAPIGGGKLAAAENGPFLRAQRRRMNFLPILLALFVPWILFCTVSGVLTFPVHYRSPVVCWSVVIAGAIITLLSGFYARAQMLYKGYDAERAPSWIVFFFGAMVLAWLLAVYAGQTNYGNHLLPYLDMQNLGSYKDVFPNRLRGQQLMDAGMVTFAEGTRVEVQKSMGFRNGGLYCVAPITIGDTKMGTYDFWAVGKDCCSGYQADFHCQGFNDPNALGGLRLMEDGDRAFFRLAVQQAEATYDIKAAHPLFFHWVTDAPATVEEWYEEGKRMYLMGIFSYFVLQAFLVAAATVAFSKIGHL